MLRRVFRLSLPPLLAACTGAPGAGDATGRLRFERDGALLVEAAATASRCTADSTIAIVAVGGTWVAAASMQVTWPLEAARELPIVTTATPGSALLAARPVADSVGLAVMATRGVVRLEPGTTIDGAFDAYGPTQPGAPDSFLLTGRFRRIPVTGDICPAVPPQGGTGPGT